MRNFAPSKKSTTFVVRLGAFLFAAILFAVYIAPTASMQDGAQSSAIAAAADIGSAKSDSAVVKDKNGNVVVESSSDLSPDLITGTTYAFAAGADTLEDMSSGTTNLVAAGSDDGNSALFNIGFEFWYDGVRFTQFGVNANGFARLGLAPTGTSFTNSIATTTNAPKIMPYWDDIWVGTNGQVHFKVVGTAPSRKLVVEWQNITIPRPGAATTGAGTFQMWLYESSHATLPGVIAFVYGNGIVANAANGGYSIGLQSGGATNFASVTTTGDTVSYAAANNTQTNAIALGKKYTFTPNVPAAPSGLNFTAVTATSMTVNWTDNAINEFGYVVYRSTDGVNFTFLTQLAAGATSFPDSALTPSTTYFYQVYAVTEGALSTPALAGSQATSAAGNVTSVASGNWSAGATWSGGVPPTNNDSVTIAAGHTVTIDSSNAFSVTILSGGILQFEATTARTLTVGSSVTIDSGGTFQSNPAGTQTAHVLSVGTNLVNNGTLDFSTNADTAGAGITFTGAANSTFSGTGATNDVRTITVNKGTSFNNTVDLTATNFTVRGVTTDVAGFLTLTNGTLKISGSFTMTNRIFTTATYIIPTTGGIWINNPNFTVAPQAGGTTSANNGLLRMTQGVYNIGLTGADGLGGGTGANFIVEGGVINATRIDPQNAVSFTITAGTINISPTTANTRSNFGSFELFSTTSTFTMSGGTINLIQAAVAATPIDYQVLSVPNITGGTLNVGTAATVTNFNFRIRGNAPALVVDNTTNNKTATFTAQTIIRGSVLVNTGTTYDLNGLLVAFTGTFTNNGTVTGTTGGSRFYFLGGTPAAAQTYLGTGIVTVPMADITIDNPLGVTFTPAAPDITTLRINMFRGNITNTGELTLGNGGVTTGVVQFGVAASPVPAGSFDVAPVFNLGTGGQIILYAQEGAMRTTGNEINPTRILFSMSVDNTNHVTLTGGDLTLSNTAVALTLTNGRFITGANTLILASGSATVTRTNGSVDGNFRKTYAAAASKLFEVGTANGFSPVTVNATAGTFPATFTAKATQGPHPAVNPATSVQRYWTLSGSDITADLTFQYLAADALGTEANYKVIRAIGGTSVAFPTSTVNTVAHTASLTGVSSFSDWTAGEISAPTAAPATISGRVTTTSGGPLAGVTMNLGGARSARTVTDANGNFRFSNIATDSFYTVSPAITNYHFSPGSRSYSLLANVSDAVFTGSLDEVITGNVIDSPDYFVRQHYLDFLGREPDQAGLNFWTDQLRGCGNDFNCLERRTINVSAAYFLSTEFQRTGGLVDALYRASYGRAPLFAEFLPDTATVAHDVVVGNNTGWEQTLAENTQEFLDAWVERAAFRAAYDNLSNNDYVDALISNTRVEFTAAERATLVNGLTSNTLSRAQVLQRLAENEQFGKAKFNEAFVRMQYFGYLRRDPDDSGLHFWVQKLNEFEGNFERADMVKAFLVSGEYRDRFRQ